jgi:O-acetyl-ADP-ribose deacetylase (regulator of RNase III)
LRWWPPAFVGCTRDRHVIWVLPPRSHDLQGRDARRQSANHARCWPAFELAPVHWVIHAVGPRYSSAASDPDLLRSAYRSALARADAVGARTVAVPSISTGSYGYPAAEAAQLSVQALRAATTGVQSVLLVARTSDMAQRWHRALDGRRRPRT